VLSPDLQTFIRRAIRSVWSIELLLLIRQDPQKTWTPPELVRALRASAAVVEASLAPLRAAGVVAEVTPGAFGYAPASTDLGLVCDELEREFKARPATVVNAVVMAGRSKVQGLADAFRFRGSDE
jgi:hypothetical protein